MFIVGIYKVSPPTLTDGTEQQVLLDANGNLKVSGTVTVTDLTEALGLPGDEAVTDPEAAANINEHLGGIKELMQSPDPSPVIDSRPWTRVSTKTNTLLASGEGTLGDFWVNTVGTADTVEFFDTTNTGAPANSILVKVGAPLALGLHQLPKIKFTNGCVVTTGGTTAGNYTFSAG